MPIDADIAPPAPVTSPSSLARLVVFGHGSFIAGYLAEAAAGLPFLGLPHSAAAADIVCAGDLVVNCAIHPEFRTAPYDPGLDIDLRIASAAAARGAHFTMLSTRRVYPASSRWDAVETADATGDEKPYGKNKARSERAVMEATSGRALILRMSNIFGPEYVAGRPRASFIGQMLHSLRVDQIIRFDMHPDTKRDFLPVTACAQAILAAAQRRLTGVFNLGCGFPVRCGDIADWTMIGYKGGQLVVDRPEIHDEFFLNMGKWRTRFPPAITPTGLKTYCIGLGWGLHNA